MDNNICRICLVIGVKCFSVQKYPQLIDCYETVSGIKLQQDEIVTFCYECTSLLRKYIEFRQKCIRGFELLNNLFCTDQDLNISSDILDNIRGHYELTSHLQTSESNKNVVSIEGSDFETNEVAMLEDNDGVNVKMEMGDDAKDNSDTSFDIDHDYSAKTVKNELTEVTIGNTEQNDSYASRSEFVEGPAKKAKKAPTAEMKSTPTKVKVEYEDERYKLTIDEKATENLTQDENMTLDMDSSLMYIDENGVMYSIMEPEHPIYDENGIKLYSIQEINKDDKNLNLCLNKEELNLNTVSTTDSKEIEIDNEQDSMYLLNENEQSDLNENVILYSIPDTEANMDDLMIGEHYEVQNDESYSQIDVTTENDDGIIQAGTKKWNCVFFNVTDEEVEKDMLKREMSEAYMNAPYKCGLCFSYFRAESGLRNHMVYHDEIRGEYSCQWCHKRYSRQMYLKKHINAVHKLKAYCLLCNFIGCSMAAQKHHLNHEKPSFKCKNCNKAFAEAASAAAHAKACSRAPPRESILCRGCGRAFSNERGLFVHYNKTKCNPHCTDQAMKEQLFCKVCSLQFANETAYNKHFKYSTKHNASKTPTDRTRVEKTCSECSESFATGVELTKHCRLMHQGRGYARRMLCEVCGAIIAVCGIQIHMERHSGNIYTCDLCNKEFLFKRNLIRHFKTQIHSDERPFACTRCSYKFHQKTSLEKHVLHVHMGVPYPRRIRIKREPNMTPQEVVQYDKRRRWYYEVETKPEG